MQTDDIRKTLDAAVAHGAEVVMSPVTMPDGLVELAQFRDPEGNWLGLINDRSQFPKDGGQGTIQWHNH